VQPPLAEAGACAMRRLLMLLLLLLLLLLQLLLLLPAPRGAAFGATEI
jgi:hypothetical protein